MRHAEHRRGRGGQRGVLVGAALVAVATIVATIVVDRRDGPAELRPLDETAVAVQAYVRHARPAAVVTACARTALRVPRVNGRVWRCTVRSPGSGYRATLCVTLSEDVVRAVAPAQRGRCVQRR